MPAVLPGIVTDNPLVASSPSQRVCLAWWTSDQQPLFGAIKGAGNLVAGEFPVAKSKGHLQGLVGSSLGLGGICRVQFRQSDFLP